MQKNFLGILRLKLVDFWNSLLTEKSWNLLIELSKEKFKFIVIGGWGTYLWTKLHKSKDVDIALIDIKDLNFLKKRYNLKKNDRLRKYEISFDEIDVDVYVPYFSKLSIPVEDLKEYTTKVEGLTVVKPEALLILKQGAEIERGKSVKGIKDQIDIITLVFFVDMNIKFYLRLLKKYKLEDYFSRLKRIVHNFKDYQYLNLNPREFKLKKKEIVKKLNNV